MINAYEYAFKVPSPGVRCSHCRQECDALPESEFRAYCSDQCMMAETRSEAVRSRAYRYDGPLR